MAVKTVEHGEKPGMVQNREQDLAVENRAISGAEKPSADERIYALRQKIATGLNVDPQYPKKTTTEICRECYREGRFDALNEMLRLLEE